MTEMEEMENALKSGKGTDKGMLRKPDRDYDFKMDGKEGKSIPLRKPTGSDTKIKTGIEGFDNIPMDKIKSMKKGGAVSSASKRADGCCIKGKTKGRMV
jgi:hypothetical protein